MTRNEPRTLELFRSATYSFLNTNFNDVSIKDIKLYIKSYTEVYPITKDDLKNGVMAHYIKLMHSFWVEKEHYFNNNTRPDLFLDVNYKRLKFLSERFEDLII